MSFQQTKEEEEMAKQFGKEASEDMEEVSLRRSHNVSAARMGPNLRELEYSFDVNPLIEPQEITVKRRYVSTGLKRDLLDSKTGEVTGASVIRIVEERDDQEFVKIFAEGVQAAFGLSKTAFRVFQTVLQTYQDTRMNGGYVDSVYLAWFDGGLAGRDIGMSDRTFQRGLKELLEKNFIAPKAPNLFWVNPALFFKGDRVAFIKEYRRKKIFTKKGDLDQVEMKI